MQSQSFHKAAHQAEEVDRAGEIGSWSFHMRAAQHERFTIEGHFRHDADRPDRRLDDDRRHMARRQGINDLKREPDVFPFIMGQWPTHCKVFPSSHPPASGRRSGPQPRTPTKIQPKVMLQNQFLVRSITSFPNFAC